MGSDLIDGLEASVVHLLLTAFLVEVHLLDLERIVEVCHMRVVESNVSVLSDTHADDIHRMLSQEGVVSCACSLRVRICSDEMNRCRSILKNSGL